MKVKELIAKLQELDGELEVKQLGQPVLNALIIWAMQQPNKCTKEEYDDYINQLPKGLS
jgi:hypothetical protein